MGNDTTYNGWKNYETWAVGMYLDGSYTGSGTPEVVGEVVAELLSLAHPTSEYWTVEQSRRYAVADALKIFVEDDTDMGREGTMQNLLVSDLFDAAFSTVDWYELADAWIQNVAEQVDLDDMTAHDAGAITQVEREEGQHNPSY